MLFELEGRRKNFIKVIYLLLALLMGGGLIFFGIGGAQGGLGDALGLSDGSSTDPGYENQIERSQEALATNPEDQKALSQLARTYYLAGNDQLETNESTGEISITDEARSSYVSAIDNWEKYLATKPQKPDDNLATLMIQAYGYVQATATTPSETDRADQGTLEAAQIVAEARPSEGTLTTLAIAAIYAGDEKVAAQAEKDAIAAASDDSAADQIRGQIKQAEAQAKIEQAESKAESNATKESLGSGGATEGLVPESGGSTTPAP